MQRNQILLLSRSSEAEQLKGKKLRVWLGTGPWLLVGVGECFMKRSHPFHEQGPPSPVNYGCRGIFEG